MTPDDIPTEITKLVYTLPLANSRAVSQNETAALLAHFWPAIERHIRAQAAAELRENGWVVAAAVIDPDVPDAPVQDDTVPLDSPEGVALLGDYFAQEIADHYAAKRGDTPA